MFMTPIIFTDLRQGAGNYRGFGGLNTPWRGYFQIIHAKKQAPRFDSARLFQFIRACGDRSRGRVCTVIQNISRHVNVDLPKMCRPPFVGFGGKTCTTMLALLHPCTQRPEQSSRESR